MKTNAKMYVTQEVVDAWLGYYDQHKNYKDAWRAIVGDFQSGKTIGGVDWRMAWQVDPDLEGHPVPQQCPANMPPPRGWSYCNVRREIAKAAAAQ